MHARAAIRATALRFSERARLKRFPSDARVFNDALARPASIPGPRVGLAGARSHGCERRWMDSQRVEAAIGAHQGEYTERSAAALQPESHRRKEVEPCNYHGPMFRLLLKAVPLRRFANGSPIVGVLLAAEIAAMARTHLAMLNGPQRRRLLALLGQARGRPGSLSDYEQEELWALIATLQPRLFLGSATRRLSPLPVPKRVLYGPRGSSARGAAAQRR